MTTKAREEDVKRARKYLDLLKDFEDKGTWAKDFLASIGNDINEALPPMKGIRGFEKLKKGNKAGFEEMTSALGEGATAFLPAVGVLSKADKLKKLVGARKLGNAQAWIEKAGGKVLNIAEDGLATWKDAAGKVRKSLLTDRFGPRDVGLSKRQLRENPRAEDADDIAAGFTDNLLTKRADKDDIVSRVSEKSGVSREEIRERAIEGKKWEKNVDDVEDLEDELPPMKGSKSVSRPKMSRRILDDDDELPSFSGRHAADSTGISTEETHRIGNFYKIGKSGEPTYLSKAVDAGNLSPDEAIIQVVKGKEPTIYQGSGPASALNRFKKTRTGAEFYKFESKGGVGGVGVKARKRTTISAQQIPIINTGRYASALTDRIGKQKIRFASEFDKAAYYLATTKKPNKTIMKLVKKQSKFSRNTILQHGHRIANTVNKHIKDKTPIKLHPRSVQVMEEAVDPTINPLNKDFKWGPAAKQLLGLASEFKFALDLPGFRQSFRPVVTHPIKTGLPAFKNALKSVTEKGYRQVLEDLPEQYGLHSVLDTASALGTREANKLYPNLEKLKKGVRGDVYDYFTSGTLGEQIPIAGNIPSASKRMYGAFQDTVHGAETDRLASLLGTDVEGLAKHGHSELDSLVRSVAERRGFGPVGKFAPAMENLSYVYNAPRNTMASLQTWNPLNYFPESTFGGKEGFIPRHGLGGRYGTTWKSPILRDYQKDAAKMAAGYGAAETADTYLGDDEYLDLNPLSSNVGANFGNYRPDIFGGGKGIPTTIAKIFQPLLRAGGSTIDDYAGTDIESIFTGENSREQPMDFNPNKAKSQFERYRIKPGAMSMLHDVTLGADFGQGSSTDEFTNAIGEDISVPYHEDSPIRTKIPGTDTVNELLGTDLKGPLDAFADLPYSRWIGGQVTPSYPEDVYDAFQLGGLPQGIAAALLGFGGMGSATYDPFDKGESYRPPLARINIPVKKKKKTRRSGGIR